MQGNLIRFSLSMKPVSKSESRWLFWRTENPKHTRDRFQTWAKHMMAKARRRHSKQQERESE